MIDGAGQSDTVLARYARLLVVQLAGARQDHGDVEVRFAILGGPAYVTLPTTLIAPGTGWSTRTNADGRVAVQVHAGQIAGTVTMLVSVPSMDRTDTVRFVVRPGAPARMVARPADTAVYLGRSFVSRARAADRFFNLTDDVVSFSELSPGLGVSATGVVTGLRAGRAAYLASVAAVAETAWVSVVPVMGTIAVTEYPRFVGDSFALAVLELDGSGYRRLTRQAGEAWPIHAGSGGRSLRWDPTGSRIYYSVELPLPGTLGWRLYRVDVADSARRVPLVDTTLAPMQHDPVPTRDGQWVYFRDARSVFAPYSTAILRVHPDGSGLERIPPAMPNDVAASYYDISPDGVWIAYTMVPSGEVPRIHIRSIATGARTSFDVPGIRPRWSPTGDRLAYFAGDGGPLRVVNADGTGDRLVSPYSYEGTVSWSPDGRYLVGRSLWEAFRPAEDYRGTLELLEVATGVRLNLPFGSTSEYPEWRPGPAGGP